MLPSESGAASRGSPSKRSRLSLKLFQKKEAKRALDFAEPQDGGGSSPEPRGGDVYVGKHRVCVWGGAGTKFPWVTSTEGGFLYWLYFSYQTFYKMNSVERTSDIKGP